MALDEEQMRRLKEGLGGGAQQAPAAEQTSPQQGEQQGEQRQGNPLLRAFAGGVANVIEGIPVFGNELMAEEEYARTGERPGFIERQATGFNEGMSFGLLGQVNAAQRGLEQYAESGEADSYGERIGDQRRYLDENSGILGQIASALPRTSPLSLGTEAIGYGITKAVPKSAQRTLQQRGRLGAFTRAARTGLMGGAATAGYAAFQGKGYEQVMTEALTGATIGAAVSPLMEGIGAIFRSPGMREKYSINPDLDGAETIVRALRRHVGDEVVDNLMSTGQLDTGRLSQLLDPQGKDPALLETMPGEFENQIKYFAQQARKPGASNDVFEALKPLNDFLVQRAKMASPEFQEALGEVISTPDVRSPTQLAVQNKEARAQIGSQYAGMIENAPNRITLDDGTQRHARYGDYKAFVNGFFGDTANDSVLGARDAILKYIRTDQQTMRARNTPSGGRNKRFQPSRMPITAADLQQSIRQLDKVLFSGKYDVQGGSASIDKQTATEYLIPLRKGLKAHLYEMVGNKKMAELDAQYSDSYIMENAYEAGRKAFGSKRSDGYTLDLFAAMRSELKPGEMAAYAEGFKGAMVEALEGKSSAAAVERFVSSNKGRFELARATLGDDVVNELEKRVSDYALAQSLGKMGNTGGPVDIVESEGIKDVLGRSIDAGLIGLGATGRFSSGLMGGALRRQLPQSLAPESGSNLARRGGALSSMLTKPMSESLPLIGQTLEAAKPQQSRAPAMLPGLLSGVMGDDYE